MITCEMPAVTMNGQYSSAEAAQRLGIHRNTLSQWVARGGVIKCKVRRANGRRFFLGSEIIRLGKAKM